MTSSGAPRLAVAHLRLAVAGRTLIDDVSFAVRAGEVWCVLGANGAGKTLLLHTLAGLRAVDGGTIAMDGRSLAQWRLDDAARRRAFLPQFGAVAFPMTVTDAVAMGRHPHLGRWAWEGDDDHARVRSALAAMDLAALDARDVATLSGGERQRVAIATLLAQDTPLLLLDEPVAHLDLHHQLDVLDHLAALAHDGRAVVLSLHDLNLARRCATHALLFRGDWRVDVGLVADVMTDTALTEAFACRVASARLDGRSVFVAG